MLSTMAHRPYPDRERALRQIMRRHRNELPPHLLLRAAQPSGREAGERMRSAFAALPTAGAYVLSTRRLSVVSGGA
jgi:hypothetical protein